VTGLPDVLIAAVAYSRRVALRVPDQTLAAVRPRLPHWWVDADVEPEKVWELSCVDEAEFVIGDLELWVAEHAIDRIFVHAGVVAIDGRALLLPGRSFSGKTTLTAALLRAGAVYGSDEYAVIDPAGLVHPYPRPLSIRGDEARSRVSAADLGADTFVGGLPVAAVAVLQYVPGSLYDTRSISSGTAILRLFDHTVCARPRPEAALDALIAAVSDASAVSGERGPAEQAVVLIQQLLLTTDPGMPA
jgi:hypothetical protein